jgi:hypothetical protein
MNARAGAWLNPHPHPNGSHKENQTLKTKSSPKKPPPAAAGGGNDDRSREADARFIDFWTEKLRPAEVTDVREKLRAGTTPETPRLNECFYESYRYAADHMLADESMRLIHGEHLLSTRHAWVELPGDVAFDGVMQRFYRLRAYREILNARAWYSYDPWAAVMLVAQLSRRAGPGGLVQFGNWDVLLKLPWADPGNPTLIDRDRMWELIVSNGLAPELKKKRRKKAARP